MTAFEAVLTDRAAVDALRRGLARRRVLLEVRAAGGETDWRAVTGQEPFAWDAPRALTGAKRFFLPPRESLLCWRADGVDEVVPTPEPFVLFGLHACDLAAIAFGRRSAASPSLNRVCRWRFVNSTKSRSTILK